MAMRLARRNLSIFSCNLVRGVVNSKPPEPAALVSGEPLSQEEIDAIFNRLPALQASPDDQTEFNYPVELFPPPRPGTVIEEQFPQQESIPTPGIEPAQPLEVLRFAPEGEIPLAPFVSVTFNQAMVPLGTLADLTSKNVPVIVSPELPGAWHWLGTKTLTFEYDSDLIDRLPKATEYTVTIPAGTKSINGGVLAEAVTWSFSTPPPKLETMYPRELPQNLKPLVFLQFDQRIDPAAVLETITVYAGSERVVMRLATEDEISADEEVQRFVENATEGRWLVFTPKNPLPADSSVSVTVARALLS